MGLFVLDQSIQGLFVRLKCKLKGTRNVGTDIRIVWLYSARVKAAANWTNILPIHI